ncbi:MAG: APC family permease [Pirellulales bacterium]
MFAGLYRPSGMGDALSKLVTELVEFMSEKSKPDADPAKRPAPEGVENSASHLLNELVHEVSDEKDQLEHEAPTIQQKVKTLLVGEAFDLKDKRVFSHISLIAFFAWVGLGADGLSSSCYGPPEAFHHLVGHEYLAIFLAFASIFTVFVISTCYSYVIAAFPSGGGGYLVASKMLGKEVGALSGCALIVDYVLTVTVSIAAAGDAIFPLIRAFTVDSAPWLGPWLNHETKLMTEVLAIIFLIILNLRGIKESISVLMPIFLVFLITHAILITGVLGGHFTEVGRLTTEVREHMSTDIANPEIGLTGVISMLLFAYSLGAGTYTGIEAVSNSMAVMREPRVATAQRTMIYMAVSLAIAAGGLMLSYLLMDVKTVHPNRADAHQAQAVSHSSSENDKAEPSEASEKVKTEQEVPKTLNHILTEKFVDTSKYFPKFLSGPFVFTTIFSGAMLLLVAAQAGFIDGPRVLANMAHDSWMPHWFGSLSERLATHNGILLIGVAALIALVGTGGNVSDLVIMYSINVFLTFSLTMLGMCMLMIQQRYKDPAWRYKLALFIFGAILCISILSVTVIFKFREGAWKTVLVTGALAGICLAIRAYYRNVTSRLKGLDESLTDIAVQGEPNNAEPDPEAPTAVVLVGGYSGLGVHTLLNVIRFIPHHFKNIMFISVGVVDSGNFKGAEAVDDLKKYTEDSLSKYVDLARRLGFPARGYMSIGTDVIEELEQVCRLVARDFPKSIVFAGQLVFQRETWYGALLHNQTAFSLQRRLQWDGIPMVILPTRVRDEVKPVAKSPAKATAAKG